MDNKISRIIVNANKMNIGREMKPHVAMLKPISKDETFLGADSLTFTYCEVSSEALGAGVGDNQVDHKPDPIRHSYVLICCMTEQH